MRLNQRFSARLLVIAVTAVILVACGANIKHKVHYSLYKAPERPLPQKVVILPVNVRVMEMSAGGVIEEVKAWTRAAKENVQASINAIASKNKLFKLVPLQGLTADETERMEEYVALYNRVGYAGFSYANAAIPAWAHKAKHFDYSLGEGMEFIGQKTGADAAIVVFGLDIVSSSGRKAAYIFAAALGVGIPLGHSRMFIGVVDLKSGDLLWLNWDFSTVTSFRDRAGTDGMITNIMNAYPGLKPYKELAGKE